MLKYLNGILFFLILSSSNVNADDYILWDRNYDTAPIDKIIELALEQTEDLYGKSTLIRSPSMEQAEAFKQLAQAKQLDLLSAATSKELEQDFISIHFPLLKGLLGHRICLIRKGDQALFNNIKTAYDFRQRGIKVCQGEAWPDTKVLARNGFLLRKSPMYQYLFTMLIEKKCDCFLRGAQEISSEYKAYKNILDIEQNLVVHYTQPGLLYLNKNNAVLAARIELGLLRALDNGSYEQLFQELLADSLNELSLDERHYIKLNNPFLPTSVRQVESNETLWFKP